MKKLYVVFAMLLIASMALSACGTAATPAPATQPPATQAPATEASTAVPPTEAPVFTVGQVTDLGGIDDKTFNATAYAGVQRAIDELGVQGKYLESQQQSDYAKNIQQYLDENTNLIITVGFLLGVDTASAAKANPDTKFAIVDYAYPDCYPGAVVGKDCGSDTAIDNVEGLTFQTDEAAFLAGYLAAGMSKTGKVATFGGLNIPTVTIFMKGLEAGVKHYNTVKGTNVELLGWDTAADNGTFVNNFESLDDGRATAQSFVEEGADIIMPVAGPVGLGSAAYCKENSNCMIIGVDADMAVAAPEYESVVLTTVEKKMDVAVFDTIKAAMDGTFQGGGVYVGTLANNGVDIAPFHSFDSAVSAELKAEIEKLKADIISGAVKISQ
jgi:basic membrane protein A